MAAKAATAASFRPRGPREWRTHTALSSRAAPISASAAAITAPPPKSASHPAPEDRAITSSSGARKNHPEKLVAA